MHPRSLEIMLPQFRVDIGCSPVEGLCKSGKVRQAKETHILQTTQSVTGWTGRAARALNGPESKAYKG